MGNVSGTKLLIGTLLPKKRWKKIEGMVAWTGKKTAGGKQHPLNGEKGKKMGHRTEGTQ